MIRTTMMLDYHGRPQCGVTHAVKGVYTGSRSRQVFFIDRIPTKSDAAHGLAFDTTSDQ